MIDKIEACIDEHAEQFIQIRQHLHQNPELGFKEYKTTAFICSFLESLGLQPVGVEGRSGVYVDIPGTSPQIYAYRADIDALPIQEKTGAPYASKNEGVMHACGHDVHTAIALGIANALVKIGRKPGATIRIIFQPAEELTPGGALEMIERDVLKGVSSIFAAHVDPGLESGTAGLKEGPLLASADEFDVEVEGKSGHAAYPHRAIDCISIMNQIISAFYKISSRQIDPVQPVVLSITKVHAGNAYNVLPVSACLSGTIRTFDNDVRKAMPRHMEEIAKGIAAAYGATCKLTIHKGSPPLINDRSCIETLRSACHKVIGKENTTELIHPRMGAEDFSNYLQKVPGAMLRLGTKCDEKTAWSLHSSHFEIDAKAIATGTKAGAVFLWEIAEQSRDIKLD